MDMHSVVTPRGQVQVVNDVVSLTDIYCNAGKAKFNAQRPADWCADNDVHWYGDDEVVLANKQAAIDYARAIDSDVLANILQFELNAPKPAMVKASVPHCVEAAKNSRAMLLSAFESAGITQKKQIIQLTNALYVAVLGKTAAGLAQAYKCGESSIRKSLDNESLLKLLTAEMHIISYVYSEQITGLSQALTKIKQIGELVNQLSQVKH